MATISDLKDFIHILTGEFTNQQQFDEKKAAGVEFPLCRHVNTACNDKITNLPDNFADIFVVEESYYTQKGSTHPAPHIFLFTAQDDGILLTSYGLPAGAQKATFTYESMEPVAYADMVASSKFTPALYTLQNGVWEGGSTSMFSPTLKLSLLERFSDDVLEVSETMEMNGKRTFGFDEPILYRRVAK